LRFRYMETFPVIQMALGMSKLFGIDLLRNFNYPYFFKRYSGVLGRWHISLSSWLGFAHIPLGGSKGSN
jgi:D-alanyl-lipoteichoic acid acyltransferase DltB (MBOAT superfamily)